MELTALLQEQRGLVLETWFEAIVRMFPSDSQTFFRKQKNQFANPIGHTFSVETARVFDQLMLEQSTEELAEAVDSIIKVLAIQDFSPSSAIRFIFLLKDIIRNLASRVEGVTLDSLIAMEAKLDQLSMMCFDAYMKRREKVWEIRTKESKKQVDCILKRFNKLQDPSDTDGPAESV